MPEDGARLPGNRGLPLGSERTAGAGSGLAGSLFAAEDLAPRLVDGHGSSGSEVGPLADANATRRLESASGKPPAPRTSLPVHLPLLSGLGGRYQQFGR